MTVTPEAPRASHTVDELYRKHGAEVYRYAYGVVGNRPDAEDVTQSTFMNALRALERGEQPRKPGSWLITIAHNVARDRYRHGRARPTEVGFDVDRIEARPTVGEDLPSLAELTQALGRIPTPQRSALVLREFEGRPYAEIAQILGITTSALETLLFRARRSLAEELESVVTCASAARDIGRLRDGTIGRKDRRRLKDHLRECPSCAHLRVLEDKPKRSLRGLLWLPLSLPLNLFRSGHAAVTTAALHGPEVAAGASGGGLAVGAGLAAKVAAVAVTTAIAGGVGYVGVHEIAHSPAARTPRPAAHPTGGVRGAAKPDSSAASRPGAARNATLHARGAHGKAARVGLTRRPTAGKSASAPGRGGTRTSSSSRPDKTTRTLPGQARKAANTTASTTPNSNSTTAPSTSSDAAASSPSDPATGKSGASSTAENGKQSSKS